LAAIVASTRLSRDSASGRLAARGSRPVTVTSSSRVVILSTVTDMSTRVVQFVWKYRLMIDDELNDDRDDITEAPGCAK